jgi:thiamine biosynthesis lipoprotein
MKSRCVELRRARALLGTLVDIQARAGHESAVARGIEAAFTDVKRVHRLMSFHDPGSDVSRMNREAHRRSVKINKWTWDVLRAAQQFACESDGAFDVTVGGLLATWKFLPRQLSRSNSGHPERMRRISRTTRRKVIREVLRCAQDDSSSWRDIVFGKNCAIRFRRCLTIDLGGIAKGFAVDRAVDALKRAGAKAAVVNAGGDLRVFGLQTETVCIRNPLEPIRSAGIVTLKNRALATSATYFSRTNVDGHARSALIDGQTERPFIDDVSISVAAEDCITADALTKIVFVLRERARAILKRHGADALILERDLAPELFFC